MTVLERVRTYVPTLTDTDDDFSGVIIFCGIGLVVSLFAALVAWPFIPALMY
ncbi:hypothetical protein [Bradyrhizobium sp. WD16]|uniref:hypothetical protein n=1 Tax=Bradyrhizobium sp. WD16 TaxID=1521768 RepID=UPI0020A2E7F0|nr:hypothetical protein [Bradyrhizobium sp. WD16]